MFRRIWRALGRVKYRAKNTFHEWLRGREAQFHYDLRFIEPIVRTAYYNAKPFGFTTRCMLTERVVEYPLTFQALPSKPTTILDIGSGNSPLPYHLASLGHTVHAVDILPYPLKHPNIVEVRCDAMRLPFSNESFRYITAISSLEHFGLGGYGDPVEKDAPFRALDEIRRVLSSNGTLIASFPVGAHCDSAKSKSLNYAVFTQPMASRFRSKFLVRTMRFFQHVDHNWILCSEKEAFGRDSYSQGVMAIAFLVLQKRAS